MEKMRLGLKLIIPAAEKVFQPEPNGKSAGFLLIWISFTKV